ncbi:unnamed protein product [Brachionus calyciflorus]|uniref:C2H2-type domain-containing protein n=1 Tax=Brachionus calyciflorus TaxID=104777 RepID=A0A814ELF1_9BILA|nr:unnamed protein product [Brachionus calyciflorus]
MPKKIFRLPFNMECDRLKNLYSPTIDKMKDVGDDLKENFYSFVIPALARPTIIKEISESERFLCLFPKCKAEGKSFASKQKFIHHLTIIHDQELPQGGSFIAPNDKGTKPGGFWCSKCGHHYCRRDHLQNHLRTSTHCKDGQILLENPLETKELEMEQRLAIEYPNSQLPQNHEFKFEVKEQLAIEWKNNDDVEPKSTIRSKIKSNVDSLVKKMTKSFSMISFKSKCDNILKTKSKTFDNFNFNNIFTSVERKPNVLCLKREYPEESFECYETKKKKIDVILEEKNEDDDDLVLVQTLIEYEKNKF